MTIAQAFNEIAVAQGGTANNSGTIAGAIDALNDALAGSDQEAAQTIEEAVRLLGQHIGGGSASGTIEITENGEYDVSMYATADVQVSGGGSSDFSFAEVTLNITPPEGVTIDEEGLQTKIYYPSDDLCYVCAWYPATNHKVNILLYNGVGYIEPDIRGYDSEYTGYELDRSSITVSGDIEFTEEHIFIVTGDGTISGTYSTIE